MRNSKTLSRRLKSAISTPFPRVLILKVHSGPALFELPV
jgi:hypothetical protein